MGHIPAYLPNVRINRNAKKAEISKTKNKYLTAQIPIVQYLFIVTFLLLLPVLNPLFCPSNFLCIFIK